MEAKLIYAAAVVAIGTVVLYWRLLKQETEVLARQTWDACLLKGF